MQGIMVLSAVSWLVALLFLPFTGGEPPWRLPFRIYVDTFGPLEALWRFEPPLMERRRFETPSNMWYLLTFSRDSFAGSFQDGMFELWNWGARAIWFGPIHMKFAALATYGVICFPTSATMCFCTTYAFSFCLDPRISPSSKKLLKPLLLWPPEWCLILEQLDSARACGRQLSAESLA